MADVDLLLQLQERQLTAMTTTAEELRSISQRVSALEQVVRSHVEREDEWAATHKAMADHLHHVGERDREDAERARAKAREEMEAAVARVKADERAKAEAVAQAAQASAEEAAARAKLREKLYLAVGVVATGTVAALTDAIPELLRWLLHAS